MERQCLYTINLMKVHFDRTPADRIRCNKFVACALYVRLCGNEQYLLNKQGSCAPALPSCKISSLLSCRCQVIAGKAGALVTK
jgi:hypothetical protein